MPANLRDHQEGLVALLRINDRETGHGLRIICGRNRYGPGIARNRVPAVAAVGNCSCGHTGM